MFRDFDDRVLPRNKIPKSSVIGFWEIAQISASGECSSPTLVTRRTQYHFLEEKIYVRVKNGNPSSGTWELLNEGKNGYSLLVFNGESRLKILLLNLDEMVLSDGCIDYRFIRRI